MHHFMSNQNFLSESISFVPSHRCSDQANVGHSAGRSTVNFSKDNSVVISLTSSPQCCDAISVTCSSQFRFLEVEKCVIAGPSGSRRYYFLRYRKNIEREELDPFVRINFPERSKSRSGNQRIHDGSTWGI